jgi:glyoxylase-like metal-dependent hydrolase (beta-lactamase superfamily II)
MTTVETTDESSHGVRVGRIEVAPVCEGFAAIPLREEFPGRDVDWDAERGRHAWAFANEGSWAWHVHAFAVRTPERLVLVDSGLGSFPPYRPWVVHTDRQAALRRAGIEPADVADVILTHLHSDHAGGVAAPDGAPRFPNARVHVHLADRLHFAPENDREGDEAGREIDALDRAGLAVTTEDDHEVASGVRVIASPGHTPGHRSVLVEDRQELLLLTGDLLHLPVQVDAPGWSSAHDVDPARGSRSRAELLTRARRGGWLVAVSHFARPFGRIGPGDVPGTWRSTVP